MRLPTSPTTKIPSRLDAEADIRHQIATYCRGVDRCDAELIRSVYHDDAWEDHGDGYRGDPDGYTTWVIGRLTNYIATMHTIHQSRFDFSEDETVVRVETYCVAHHQYAADEQILMETLGVRYLDRFECRPDVPGWRIAHRIVVLEWHQVAPVTRPSDLGRALAVPQRDRTDISYANELPRVTNN